MEDAAQPLTPGAGARGTVVAAGGSAPPGRSCPLHYAYRPEAIGLGPRTGAEVLWVVGGLYGNRAALDALDVLLAREAERTTVVFNGDFHWFDARVEAYAEIEERVQGHRALRGNVETELASDDDEAGCGCAYPRDVDDATVSWSNAIMARLKDVARAHPGRTALARLPMHACVEVAGARVGIVHGDAWSLAGWDFAADRVDTASGAARLADGFRGAGVDVLASSHTCSPLTRRIDVDGRIRVLANNGAAGMPNLRGTRYGIATRVAARPSRWSESLYTARAGEACVESIALDYDHEAFLAEFDGIWPAGSPAARSYRGRIVDGPSCSLTEAYPGAGSSGRLSRS